MLQATNYRLPYSSRLYEVVVGNEYCNTTGPASTCSHVCPWPIPTKYSRRLVHSTGNGRAGPNKTRHKFRNLQAWLKEWKLGGRAIKKRWRNEAHQEDSHRVRNHLHIVLCFAICKCSYVFRQSNLAASFEQLCVTHAAVVTRRVRSLVGAGVALRSHSARCARSLQP